MAVKKNGKLREEKGQAIFELLVFLPILIFLYTVIFNVGNAINVSINQQKTVRRYFYFLMKGNSYLPYQGELSGYAGGVTRVSASMIGFADRLEGASGAGGTPVAPCFRFNSIFSDSGDESCDEPVEGERQTSYIRVMTVYGVCGENLSLQGDRWVSEYAQTPDNQDPRSTNRACTISDQ